MKVITAALGAGAVAASSGWYLNYSYDGYYGQTNVWTSYNSQYGDTHYSYSTTPYSYSYTGTDGSRDVSVLWRSYSYYNYYYGNTNTYSYADYSYSYNGWNKSYSYGDTDVFTSYDSSTG